MNTNNPVVCTFLTVIAWLTFFGGIIAGIICFMQYTPSTITGIAYIVSGIVSAVLFWAISEIISHLDTISTNIYALSNKTINNSSDSSPLFQSLLSDNEWECRCSKINPKEFTTCPKCGRAVDAIV